MTPFPWGDAMRLGFGVLKLSSKEFWGLTPRELAAAIGGGMRTGAPDRSELSRLMERFPDGR